MTISIIIIIMSLKRIIKKKFLMGEINVNGMSGSTVRVAAKVSSIAPSYD